jgi:predicted nuclease of restriction endonuclease-like (RecB) superfamily
MSNLKQLSHQITQTHTVFQQQAAQSVNRLLTVRNWLIGYFIVEFEQHGEDRADYGAQLITTLARQINQRGLGATNLKLARQFYKSYSFLEAVIKKEIAGLVPDKKSQLPTDLLLITNNQKLVISQSLTDPFKMMPNYPKNLLQKVSFTHFVELLKIDDEVKRQFYEWLVIKTTLSVNELKHKINTLTYERTGLSLEPHDAVQKIQHEIMPQTPSEAIKSVYLFDFLNIPTQTLVEEKELETALLNHLQQFILELGNGFCFEARQKRILIDEQYYFADLVFYHRILKCHVIVELKVDAFKHEHLSQLNTYVAYYNHEVKEPADSPAVGILLCTEKGEKLVEYATAGMDNQLFVSKYLLQLPNKEALKSFIEKEMKLWN